MDSQMRRNLAELTAVLPLRKESMKENLHRLVRIHGIKLVPEEGLEPSQGYPYRILSPARLPFHHSGARG